MFGLRGSAQVSCQSFLSEQDSVSAAVAWSATEQSEMHAPVSAPVEREDMVPATTCRRLGPRLPATRPSSARDSAHICLRLGTTSALACTRSDALTPHAQALLTISVRNVIVVYPHALVAARLRSAPPISNRIGGCSATPAGRHGMSLVCSATFICDRKRPPVRDRRR